MCYGVMGLWGFDLECAEEAGEKDGGRELDQRVH